MPKRPYLVTPDRECIPLEGPYRIEQVRGEWWVLGEHRAVRCDGEASASLVIERLRAGPEIHALAAEALEGLPGELHAVAQTPAARRRG